MGGHGRDVRRAPLGQELGGGADGAGGVDHVVDQHAVAPLDLTDDVEGLDLVVGSPGPALVHEGEVGAEVLAEALGHPHPAGVGRHDHQIARAQAVQLLHEHGRGGEVVEGDVEEALDLSGVQVDADHTVGAGHLEHVGDELGGDGLTTRRLAVLARVPVVGAYGRDALGRRPLGGVDHDELLHDRVVHGARVGLDDEDVTTAQRAVVATVDLAVGELAQIGPTELDPEVLGDLLGERRVRSPRHELETPLRNQLHGPTLQRRWGRRAPKFSGPPGSRRRRPHQEEGAPGVGHRGPPGGGARPPGHR